jgi:hypothetical protein
MLTVGVIEIDGDHAILYDLSIDGECKLVNIDVSDGVHVFFKVDEDMDASFEIVKEADVIEHVKKILEDRTDDDSSDEESDEVEEFETVPEFLRAINVTSEACGELYACACAINANGEVTINNIELN